MRVIRTSGSVRGGDGDILAYSAAPDNPALPVEPLEIGAVANFGGGYLPNPHSRNAKSCAGIASARTRQAVAGGYSLVDQSSPFGILWTKECAPIRASAPQPIERPRIERKITPSHRSEASGRRPSWRDPKSPPKSTTAPRSL